MTVMPFGQCHRTAGLIIDARLAESDFLSRMERRSATWQIEFQSLLRQVRTVIAIGIFNAHASVDPHTEVEAAKEALVLLRKPDDLELFATLPRDLGEWEAEVSRMRLLSAGATAKTAVLWARLTSTARDFLDPDAQYG